MKIIDNSSTILGDELRNSLGRGSKLRIAASCFSIYAYEALKSELNKLYSVQFVFTTPTFLPSEVTDQIRKERREFFIPKFFIPKGVQGSSVYGTEFEIQLRNKLNQKAIVRECANWFRRKDLFKSFATKVAMQHFMHQTSN